jgi:CHAD domain-containing protein
MAAPRPILGLTCDEPFRSAAGKILWTRFEEMMSFRDAALEGSAGVYDMRVASRRLRAVLEVFAPCFPKGPYRSVLRDVKRLADALGERRDPDVHLAAMEKLAESLPPALKPGVELLADRQRARQAAGNEILAAALEDLERTELRARLDALADAAEAAPA